MRSEPVIAYLSSSAKARMAASAVFDFELPPLANLCGPQQTDGLGTISHACFAYTRDVLNPELNPGLNPGAKYTFGRDSVSAFIRRFSYLRAMDISIDTDLIANEVTPELEHTMNALYPKTEATRHLRNIKRAGWRGIIAHGSARVNISTRANLAAPGTVFLAYRSETPAFLGGYGYNFRGFACTREEKLFVLWFNSTLALMELLAKATITEGSWVKLEQFTTEQLTIPDPAKLPEEHWKSIEECWELVSKSKATSLLEQLTTGSDVRERVDVTLLQVMGADKITAKAVSTRLRLGVLATIELLRRTMGKASKEPAEEEDEAD